MTAPGQTGAAEPIPQSRHKSMTTSDKRPSTRLVHSGSHPERHKGVMNTPVYRASTILFPTSDAMRQGVKNRFDSVFYGRHGTPTTMALEEAVADLERGYRSIAVPSGVSAIMVSLLSFLKSGDHLLMTDTAYSPSRDICTSFLANYGVSTDFYDPMIGAGIKELIRPETKAVFSESPGSLTFEIQDIPAIAEVAHAHGIKVIMDNTWSAGFFFKPFEHGVDVSIQAATKYLAGHSDVMAGIVTASNEEDWKILKTTSAYLGMCLGGDDAYLTSRGIRTLDVRLEQHQASGLKLAEWFKAQPEVEKVLHPAFPECPGHDTWQRDFTGASGLFGILLKDLPDHTLSIMLDNMELFGMGFSWGGFESLLTLTSPPPTRSAVPWAAVGHLLRVHAGQEDPDDLIDDLEAGFKRLREAV